MSSGFSSGPAARQVPLPVGSADTPAIGGDAPKLPAGVAPAQLRDAVAAFCLYLSDESRAPHTVRSTELDLRGLLEHLGDRLLADIGPTHLAAHVHWLRTARHNGSSSLRRKIATLKMFFRHAVVAGWLTDSPAEALVYPPLQRAALVALSPNEIEAVVEAGNQDPAWHAIVLLFVDAGLKRDEVLALQAEDLYLARAASDSRVTIRHASQAKHVRRRSVPLTPRAHFALLRLLQAPLPGGPLFSISVRGGNFVVETLGRRAHIDRIKKLTPEILRDSFAVRAMRSHIESESPAGNRGTTARELNRLRAQHDQQLLQLLGLSRYSDMAARYRAAAVVESPGTTIPSLGDSANAAIPTSLAQSTAPPASSAPCDEATTSEPQVPATGVES